LLLTSWLRCAYTATRRVTDAPQIHSNGFHIAFDLSHHQSLGYVLPEWLGQAQVQQAEQAAAASRLRLGAPRPGGSSSSSSSVTKIVLPFKQGLLAGGAAAEGAGAAAGVLGGAAAAEGGGGRALRHKFADVQPALLLFLRRLRCIAITDAVEPALSSVMARRQLAPGLLELSSGRDGQQRSR
jgi:hypothetical protein